MNEDDTFRILKRTPFNILGKEISRLANEDPPYWNYNKQQDLLTSSSASAIVNSPTTTPAML
jgi:hypothetical protein